VTGLVKEIPDVTAQRALAVAGTIPWWKTFVGESGAVRFGLSGPKAGRGRMARVFPEPGDWV
jgi:hypothetical protein